MNVLEVPCRQGSDMETERAPGRILVSVIIPTLNEQESIGRCLDALKRMDFPKEGFEVILVDNGSNDRTLEIAKSYAIALNLRTLQRPKVYVSSLRNLGAAAARGNYLAFLDADVIVPRKWMCSALAELRGKGAGVVGGPYHIPGNSSWVAKIWFEYRKPYESGDVSYLASGNLFISRALSRASADLMKRLRPMKITNFASERARLACRYRPFRSLAWSIWALRKSYLLFIANSDGMGRMFSGFSCAIP